MDLPPDLRLALESAGAGLPRLGPAVERLIARYRLPDTPASEPILAGAVEVDAYAAYRMPATYAAVRAVLAQVTAACPQLDPGSLLDVGGGTGAAAWAATEAFAGLAQITVLDQVAEALDLGRRLGRARPALRDASWRRWRHGEALPAADLVTVSYVLGELPPPRRTELVAAAASAAASALVVVEPGTPLGYARVLAARDALLAEGWRVVAPCPHGDACPLAGSGTDWCHFAARVNRSAVHRRAKGATLGYEDEKFAYVAVTRAGVGAQPARVLRHPEKRKGLVKVRLCAPSGAAVDEVISQRQGERYRAARDLSWGDPWD